MSARPRARRPRPWALAAMLALGAWAVTACDRDPEPRAMPTAKGAAAPKPKAPPDTIPTRFPAAKRLVAIGDVHGDLSGTLKALRLAGAIDEENDWIGGKLVVVQTGDQLDRGDDERAILELFAALEKAARSAGGAFHVLLGNHEVMNAMADFRYVTPGGFTDFREVTGGNPAAHRFQLVARGRAAAFLPGGRYALHFAKRNTVAIVGDTAFAHGGILAKHVDYGIEKLNREVRAWMRGNGEDPPGALVSEDAPIWTRKFSEPSLSADDCRDLDRLLAKLKVARMVVGHTTQKDGITSACDEKVWRIDVGISKHYGGRIQALEIAQTDVDVGHHDAKTTKLETKTRILPTRD